RIVFSQLPERDVALRTLEDPHPHRGALDRFKAENNPVAEVKNKIRKKAGAPSPSIGHSFPAQAPSGTPLDNNLAVAGNGLILSAVNTTIRVTDSTGSILFTRTLSAIANELGTLNRTFDPHVVFDTE